MAKKPALRTTSGPESRFIRIGDTMVNIDRIVAVRRALEVDPATETLVVEVLFDSIIPELTEKARPIYTSNGGIGRDIWEQLGQDDFT